jgi:drug/metabolite transporter (DMT)-like permease
MSAVKTAPVELHRTTGRWKVGLAMALTAAILWGVLPIALDVVLENLDVYTLTWYRFTSACLTLGVILRVTNQLPTLKSFPRSVWLLLGGAFVGLTGNYVLYIKALQHSSPTIVQTVGQLGPAFLLFGGLLFFKESFSRLQWAGFAVLSSGLVLFFNNRFLELIHVSAGLGLGVVLLVTSTLLWTAYGLAQKRLLAWLGPQQILFLIYIGAAVVLFPWTAPGNVRHLSALQFGMLVFCCINTLAGYGAFAEGLKHWEISRFGAVLATSPLFTVLSMWILERFLPNMIAAERLNAVSLIGTFLVVGGSATCALARRAE